jgi:alanine dehydrogenase
MPGAVGRTSTYALCNVTFPYVFKLAERSLAATASDPGFAAAVNMHKGQVTNQAVAETFGMKYVPFNPAA